MKNLAITLILFLGLGMLPAHADTWATNTFVVSATNTVTVVTSGTLSANIDGFTGTLSTPLNVNFNITANEDVNDIILRARVVDSGNSGYSGIYSTGSTAVASENIVLVLFDKDDPLDIPSITNAKHTGSTSIDNPCAIAYPGTLTIDNSGTVQYVANGEDGYFNAMVKAGTTDLNLSISTTAKSGTYDCYTALDCPGSFEVEVFLDNIPG